MPKNLGVDSETKKIVKKILSKSEEDKNELLIEKNIEDEITKAENNTNVNNSQNNKNLLSNIVTLQDYQDNSKDRYMNSDSEEEENVEQGCAQS